MSHQKLIGSFIFKGHPPFCWGTPKMSVFVGWFFFPSWSSQFSKEEFSFISGPGDKSFDKSFNATHLGTKLGSQYLSLNLPVFTLHLIPPAAPKMNVFDLVPLETLTTLLGWMGLGQ